MMLSAVARFAFGLDGQVACAYSLAVLFVLFLVARRIVHSPFGIALQATLQATITQWLGHVLDLHDLSVRFSETDAVLEIDVTYETLASKTGGRLTVRKDLT